MAESSPERKHCTVADRTRDANSRWSAIEKLDTELAASWRAVAINERSRFRLWSNNLGAGRPFEDQRSADHQLRAAPDIQGRIVQLLEELCEGLDDIQEIQSGEREGEQEEEEQEEIDVTIFPGDNETTRPRSEISELWLMVGDVITSLLKVSVLVRQSSSRDRFDHAVRAAAKADTSSTSMASDIENVRHKFPKLESKQWLLQRLGEASKQRRSFLMYAQDYERRFASAKKESTSRPPEAATRAKTLPPAKADVSILEDHDGAGAASTTLATLHSASRSVDDDDTRQVVPLSSVCVGGQPAICPYCRDVVHFKKEKAWRRHVFEDLVAYTCTFEECDHGPFGSLTAWTIHEQRQHLHSWKCPLCHEDFDTHALVVEHMAAAYPSVDQDLLGDLIYAASPQIEQVPISQCPFCDDSRWADHDFEGPVAFQPKAHDQGIMHDQSVSVSLYHQHTSHHMEQLALLAIPAVAHDGKDSATDHEVITNQSTMNRMPSTPSSRSDDSRRVARQWFIPGDGIDRHVIVTDIQRYLGIDATVRPGQGTGENDSVMGYWIKAYRNLTTAMIADLRADSARWRQEQRLGSVTREYVGSNTYHLSQAARVPKDIYGDLEGIEAPYSSAVTRDRDRTPVNRMPIAPQYPYDQKYGVDPGGLPDIRSVNLPQEQALYGRAQNAMFARSDANHSPLGGSAPPGYVRQGNYYVPISSAEQPMWPNLPIYGGPHRYSQQLQPQRMESARDPRDPRDPRDVLRDPRDPRDLRDPRDPRHGQAYPQDPRYAYPTPSATTASMPRGERSSIDAAPPGYLRQGNYNFPVPASASGREPSNSEQTDPDESVRDPYYGRGGPAPTTSDSARNARRRM